ncbi:MAG: hypothetical protein H7Z41_13465 [Cytophagales bacterium]|nr:hypothetical protein [Armatimonadota bacterium]
MQSRTPNIWRAAVAAAVTVATLSALPTFPVQAQQTATEIDQGVERRIINTAFSDWQIMQNSIDMFYGGRRRRRTGPSLLQQQTTRGKKLIAAGQQDFSWNPAAGGNSRAISELVKKVPAGNRAVTTEQMKNLIVNYPMLVKALNDKGGASLRADDVVDSQVVSGVYAYEILSGKDITPGQFQAERQVTQRSWKRNVALVGSGKEYFQYLGEYYALNVGYMALLQSIAEDPNNPERESAGKALQQIARKLLKECYNTQDPSKITFTSTGSNYPGKK